MAYALSFWPEVTAGFIAASVFYFVLFKWPEKTIGLYAWQTTAIVWVLLVILITINWFHPPPDLEDERLINFDVFHGAWLVFLSYPAIRNVQKKRLSEKNRFFRQNP